MSKVGFATPFKTVPVKAFPDKPYSQCRKPKNSSLISPLPSTNLITRDSCSWLEQSEASSAKIEKNLFSFDLLDKYILDIVTTAINQFILGGFRDIACIFTASP